MKRETGGEKKRKGRSKGHEKEEREEWGDPGRVWVSGVYWGDFQGPPCVPRGHQEKMSWEC